MVMRLQPLLRRHQADIDSTLEALHHSVVTHLQSIVLLHLQSTVFIHLEPIVVNHLQSIVFIAQEDSSCRRFLPTHHLEDSPRDAADAVTAPTAAPEFVTRMCVYGEVQDNGVVVSNMLLQTSEEWGRVCGLRCVLSSAKQRRWCAPLSPRSRWSAGCCALRRRTRLCCSSEATLHLMQTSCRLTQRVPCQCHTGGRQLSAWSSQVRCCPL